MHPGGELPDDEIIAGADHDRHRLHPQRNAVHRDVSERIGDLDAVIKLHGVRRTWGGERGVGRAGLVQWRARIFGPRIRIGCESARDIGMQRRILLRSQVMVSPKIHVHVAVLDMQCGHCAGGADAVGRRDLQLDGLIAGYRRQSQVRLLHIGVTDIASVDTRAAVIDDRPGERHRAGGVLDRRQQVDPVALRGRAVGLTGGDLEGRLHMVGHRVRRAAVLRVGDLHLQRDRAGGGRRNETRGGGIGAENDDPGCRDLAPAVTQRAEAVQHGRPGLNGAAGDRRPVRRGSHCQLRLGRCDDRVHRYGHLGRRNTSAVAHLDLDENFLVPGHGRCDQAWRRRGVAADGHGRTTQLRPLVAQRAGCVHDAHPRADRVA